MWVSQEVEGEYSEEGGEWKPLSKETEFGYRELRDIAVRDFLCGK